jgi:Glutaredoxin-like domain (DUF836)
MTREVTLYTRSDCGLCNEAVEELWMLRGPLQFTLIARNVDDDPALVERFNHIVPVIAVGDEIVASAPIDFAGLRDQLAAALG